VGMGIIIELVDLKCGGGKYYNTCGSEMWGWDIIELVDLKCGDGNCYRTCGSEMWGWELL